MIYDLFLPHCIDLLDILYPRPDCVTSGKFVRSGEVGMMMKRSVLRTRCGLFWRTWSGNVRRAWLCCALDDERGRGCWRCGGGRYVLRRLLELVSEIDRCEMLEGL